MIRLLGPHRHMLAILIIAASLFGVTSLYTRLSATDDENFHIACGMEWLKDGTYTKQVLHPPLARVADAFLPYLVKMHRADHPTDKTQRELYFERLVLSRLGTLPFYLFSCLLVYAWSRRLFGELPALLSLALYGSLSTVTAHASLATTDMDYTALLLWAILCGIDWLDTPNWKRSLLLGLSMGLTIGAKYSALAQWPAAMATIVLARCLANYKNQQPVFFLQSRYFLHAFMISLPALALALALIFRFNFDPLVKGIADAAHMSEAPSSAWFNGQPHNRSVWFYGPLHGSSVWYFFPVVFFFKTPLPFFAAVLLGSLRIVRTPHLADRLYPLLAAAGILLISMTSHINLGVRHVLALYPLLAIPAGYGVAWLWNGNQAQRSTARILVACQLLSFLQAYPEHLAYFNLMAGKHPEHITLDSDFDWGQDIVLLDEALEQRGIESAYMCERRDAFHSAAFVVRAKILPCPATPVTGWVAAGRAYLLLDNNSAWLKSYKAVQIGNSTMDLYYIPPKEP